MTTSVRRYFDVFNAGDIGGMLDCLSDDAEHHVNEGKIRIWNEKFRGFCDHMNRCYREELTDMVLSESEGGKCAAAEYVAKGACIATDEGLSRARGLTNRLPTGCFFALGGQRITRVTTYYNLADWLKQVS